MKARQGPLHSMSGFGRATASGAGIRVTCEARSVNQRGLDVSVSLPDRMLWADTLVRRRVSARVVRGRVDVTVSFTPEAGRGGAPAVDAALAARYARELRSLARRLGLDRPRVESLLGLPGVLAADGVRAVPGRLEPAIRRAVDGAMDRLVAMRRREGAALSADLGRRFSRLARLAAAISAGWPAAAARQRERLHGRLEEALERAGKDRGGARELVSIVERGDVSEEITRIGSHLEQCRAALTGGSPAGRKIEFLVQELQRETNTIGAKSNDAGLTRVVLAAKEEIERVREQAANIE